MTQKSIAREQAIQKGQLKYHGSPCKRCGNTEKFVSGWSCVSCTTERTLTRSPEVHKRYQQSEKGKERNRRYRTTDTHKQVQKRWIDRSGYGRHITAQRRKYIKEQLQFLSPKEIIEITKIYKKAKQLTNKTGIMHHVDHKIRLADGGKHHPKNLQILTNKKHKIKTTLENRKGGSGRCVSH